MQFATNPECVPNPRSFVNVYRRASKLFARMTHSSRSRSRQQESSSKSDSDVSAPTTHKRTCKHQQHRVCPIHGKRTEESEPSKRNQVFYPVLIEPPRKRSSPNSTNSTSSLSSIPTDSQFEYAMTADASSNLKHSSPLRSGMLHRPIIKSSSTSTNESLSSIERKDSLVLAFNRRLEKGNKSRFSNDSSLSRHEVINDASRQYVAFPSSPSMNLLQGIGIYLLETSSDGTYIVQFRRESPMHRFGIFFNQDNNGYYISKQTGELECRNDPFVLRPHDRVLFIQGVPSRLLSPSGIKVLLRGCLMMTIKIAPLRCK